MTIPRQLPRVFAFGLLLGLVSTFASAANPFGPVQLLTTAGTDRGLFLRDMDGDGNLDLITTSTTQVQIHYGTTTGYTQTPTVVSPVLQAGWSIQAASTFDIATAPLNADSYVDLIVYSASSDNIKDPSRKAQVDNFLAGSARGFQKLFATVFNEATNLEQIYPHSTHLGIADLYFKFTNRLEFYFLFDPLTGTFKSRPVKSAVPKGKFEEFLINGSPQIILKNEGSKKKFSRIYIFASMADSGKLRKGPIIGKGKFIDAFAVDLDNDTYYDGVNLTRTKKAALINISYGLSNFKQERFQKAIDLQSLDVQQLQVDDINGDGVLDLLVLDKDSSSGAARIRFFVGNAGSRIFTETGSVLVPQLSNLENLRLYSADLNGDSKVDLLFADDLSQSLYLLNQISFAASPVFEDAIQISVSGSLSIDIRSIECRDLNADGKPDVILKDKSSSSSKVFYLLGQ